MKPDYQKIYSIVKEKFESTTLFCYGPFDETYYTLRVYEICKKLIEKVGGNKEIILTAALLHDVGKTKLRIREIYFYGTKSETAKVEWRRHAKLSVPLAVKILRQLGHSEEFIKKVCYLIEFHDSRTMDKKSLDLKILQDADFIADFGFAGFIRPFLYGTRFKRSIVDSIRFALKGDKERRYDYLNLDISRQMAKEKMELQKRLVKGISMDLESDVF